jgi:hypothetical protein
MMELAGLVGFCGQTKQKSVRRQLIHAIDDQFSFKRLRPGSIGESTLFFHKIIVIRVAKCYALRKQVWREPRARGRHVAGFFFKTTPRAPGMSSLTEGCVLDKQEGRVAEPTVEVIRPAAERDSNANADKSSSSEGCTSLCDVGPDNFNHRNGHGFDGCCDSFRYDLDHKPGDSDAAELGIRQPGALHDLPDHPRGV